MPEGLSRGEVLGRGIHKAPYTPGLGSTVSSPDWSGAKPRPPRVLVHIEFFR